MVSGHREGYPSSVGRTLLDGTIAEAQRRHTIGVLLLAALLRLLVIVGVLLLYPGNWFFQRGVEMSLLAHSLLTGQGLSSPFGVPTGPTAFIAPGYPLLTAAVFWLFGEQTRLSAAIMMVGQLAVALITVWLLMHLARSLFGERACLVAGLFWACSPPLLWIPTIAWDTSLSICLLLGLLTLILHLGDHVSCWMWIFLGAYCALAGLLNPALLPALSTPLLWLAWKTRSNARNFPLLAALSFAVVFAPWPVRNARVFHAFVPLRTTVGFELWMGNREGASGYLEERLFPMYNQLELSEYRILGEIRYTTQKSGLARRYIESHAFHFLRMTGLRMVRFWTGTGTERGSLFFAFHACLTSLLGLGGLSILWRQRSHALATLFAGPLLLFPLPYYCTHAEFRYRLLLDPLLTLLASYYLIEMRSNRIWLSPLRDKVALTTGNALLQRRRWTTDDLQKNT